MRNRPKGAAHIHEVEGDKEIIVVIPTADFNGEFARNCRENVFKGVHTVFVESGEILDPYFNYAHNCNVGIQKAMKYCPKWIVLSNDDMYKIEDVSVLIFELSKLDFKRTNCVFTRPSKYHSVPARFGRPRFTRRFIIAYKRHGNLRDKLKFTREQIKIEKKFGCREFFSPRTGLTNFIFEPGYNLISFTDFGIFSADYIRKQGCILFDETFINAQEDHDVALQLFTNNDPYAVIDFKIGDYVGSTMGTGLARDLREIAGNAYLNYKWENKLLMMEE